MSYQRTQIYLDPADHRRLSDEAHRRGLSLAALIREIVGARMAPWPSHDPDGFDALIGIVASGEPTDIAVDEEAHRADALDARYRKKMGQPAGDRPPRGRRGKST